MNRDWEETVKLILMENFDTPLKGGWDSFKAIHPEATLTQFTEIWVAYKGMDRVRPWKKL